MADILPTTAHLNPLWVTAYDDYPMQSIREKERLIPYFMHHNYWFLFYHDENYFAVKYLDDFKTIDTFISRQKGYRLIKYSNDNLNYRML